MQFQKLEDEIPNNLKFIEDSFLITEPNKTNRDFGWSSDSTGKLTNKSLQFSSATTKLVLSTLLPSGVSYTENIVQQNKAIVEVLATIVEVQIDAAGKRTESASRTETWIREAYAPSVIIVPPTGGIEVFQNIVSNLYLGIAVTVGILVCCICITDHKRTKKREITREIKKM